MNYQDSDPGEHTDDTDLLLQTSCPLPIVCSEPLSPKKTPKKHNFKSKRNSYCKRSLKFNRRDTDSSSDMENFKDVPDEFFDGKFLLREIDNFLDNIKHNSFPLEDTFMSNKTPTNVSKFSSGENNVINRSNIERVATNFETLGFSKDLANQKTSTPTAKSVNHSENFAGGGKLPENLPSLSSLWNKTSTNSYCALDEKIEEERMRRQHCEKTILDLQQKSLEQQQKIAVAVEIDNTKNSIIQKLQETCKLLSSKISTDENNYRRNIDECTRRLKSITEENNKLQKEIETVELKMSNMLQLENEAYEKSKSLELEIECIENKHREEIDKLKESFKDKEERFAETKESYAMLIQINKQLSDNIVIVRENLDKVNKSKSDLENELSDLKKQHNDVCDEKTILIMEKNDLKNKLNEEAMRNRHLDNQKMKLQSELESEIKKLSEIEREFDNYKNQVEHDKSETKMQYQKQVENIVLNKLREFQEQLSDAETLMENELKSKEHSIATTYASQLQRIEQQHKTEINIIEERHREEIKYYNLQLTKSNKKINQLEDYISSYKQKRGHIAAQLHNIMENQWKEALKVISNSSEVDGASRYSESNSKTPQLNILDNKKDFKSKSNVNDENLEEYIKMLLQKPPGASEKNENNAKCDSLQAENFAMYQNMEYPTNDKNFESGDRKNNFKPPWKY